jgi:ferritin-like metal-binding protein YciE
MNVTTLWDLLLRELRRTRGAEILLEGLLLGWSERLAQGTLRRDTTVILGQTRQRIQNIDRAFQLVGLPVDAPTVTGEVPIVRDFEQLLEGIDSEVARDAAMAAGLALLGHCMVARYGFLACWAERLQKSDLALLLKATLDKEHGTPAHYCATSARASNDISMGERLTALFDKKK